MEAHEFEPRRDPFKEMLDRISLKMFSTHADFVYVNDITPVHTRQAVLLRSPDGDLYRLLRSLNQDIPHLTIVDILSPHATEYDPMDVYESVLPALVDYRTVEMKVRTRLDVPSNEFIVSDLTYEYLQGLEADLAVSTPVEPPTS